MHILKIIEWPYYMCIEELLLALNGIDIMVTLCVYFEYIKTLCQIFIKYIATILQVYLSYIIIFLKIITKKFIIFIINLFIEIKLIFYIFFE
jgi:hypothetical protein